MVSDSEGVLFMTGRYFIDNSDGKYKSPIIFFDWGKKKGITQINVLRKWKLSRIMLGKHWRDTSMGAQFQCSPGVDHDFLVESPLMEFHVEVCQASSK